MLTPLESCVVPSLKLPTTESAVCAATWLAVSEATVPAVSTNDCSTTLSAVCFAVCGTACRITLSAVCFATSLAVDS